MFKSDRMMRLAAGGIAIAVMVPAVAMAQGPGGPGKRAAFGDRPSFETLDANGDGQITVAEFKALAQARFDRMDADGNGVISEEEMTARAAEKAAEKAARRFARLLEWRDADGDGALSAVELADGRGEKLFARADSNGDGVISAEEYAAAMEKAGQRGNRWRRGGGHQGGPRGHGPAGDGGRDGGENGGGNGGGNGG